MKGTGREFIIVVLVGLFLFGMGQVVWAEKWQPFQFNPAGNPHL